MNCREISERASDFIDAALPWHVRLEVRLHLMMCRFCREYVRQMELIAQTLRRLPLRGPAPGLDQQLLDRFRAEHR